MARRRQGLAGVTARQRPRQLRSPLKADNAKTEPAQRNQPCNKGPTMAADRIDVHAHYVTDGYRAALAKADQLRPDGIPGVPEWDTDSAITAMNNLGVKTAMLSISSPGVHLGDDDKATELARLVNEDGARIVSEYPDRFGLFASLPLPDVDAAVAEARYALDDLRADGIVLMTNHGGVYLGDERLQPLYAELDKRSAVVFIHPTSAPNDPPVGRFAAPVFEFMFETTRTIVDLVAGGVLHDFPNLHVIVPHAGATLPVIASRVDLFGPFLPRHQGQPAPPALRTALEPLHYDLAGCPVDEQLAALMTVAKSDHLHYGSYYPFTPEPACQYLAAQLDASRHLNNPATATLSENSRRLFARIS
jgi:6-methylsalicylate decarboxylase